MGRATVGGLLLGVLVFGGIRFARSALPGLGEGAGAPDPLSPDDSQGKNLDIVLPEEGPGEYRVSAEPLGALAAEPDGLVTAAPAGVEAEAEGEIETLVDIGARESGGPLSGASSRRGDSLPGAAFTDYDEDEAEAPGSLLDDGAEAAVPPVSAVASPALRSGGGLDDLDVLPDLEGFSDSFAAPEYNPADAVSEGGSDFSVGRVTSGRQPDTAGLDPAAMAQAVRTILKRDTKG